jgi:glycosyltransferase involved in cell wall biosynthesis
MPELSIVIPSYNHARFIARAVNSVLNQSFKDLELIVVDDGSTDDSLRILAGFPDPRLCVISQENRGAHAAINRGLAETSGTYLTILNSDDEYRPDRFEKLLPILKADTEIGLIGSYIEVIDTAGKTLGIKHGYKDLEPWALEFPERSFRSGDDLRAAVLTENYWSTTSNYLFPRQWYERVGEFRGLRYAHDWDFALRVARQAKLVLHPEPLVRYRVHGGNTIRENQAAMIFEICWCLAVHLPQHVADPSFFEQVPPATRVDQLLHSIYVYDCERVLIAMLVHSLSNNIEHALQLLDTNNPIRKKYIEYIQSVLAQPVEGIVKQSAGSPGAMISRLLQRVRRMNHHSV